MSTLYPPGLTARDIRHIDGPAQQTSTEHCGAEATWVPTSIVKWHTEQLHHAIGHAIRTGDAAKATAASSALLEDLRSGAEHVAQFPCEFEGDVDVAYFDTGKFTADTEWACPRCGTVHEGDIDTSDDYAEHYADLARDELT